jgi:uncharacterized protein YukE
MISPATGRGRIFSALKDLRFRWEDTQRFWDDAASRDFTANLWQPLEAESQAVIRAIDQLSQIMHQMQNECE